MNKTNFKKFLIKIIKTYNSNDGIGQVKNLEFIPYNLIIIQKIKNN